MEFGEERRFPIRQQYRKYYQQPCKRSVREATLIFDKKYDSFSNRGTFFNCLSTQTGNIRLGHLKRLNDRFR